MLKLNQNRTVFGSFFEEGGMDQQFHVSDWIKWVSSCRRPTGKGALIELFLPELRCFLWPEHNWVTFTGCAVFLRYTVQQWSTCCRDYPG